MTSKKDNIDKIVNIKEVEIEDQMKVAYLDYAMSVIVGRALPDVRDGLKPVHRRILHAMNERAWRSDRPYVKSAKIVGEVIGNYHPHGDLAVYDTMVRMAQDFSMRMTLIDGQGNFGSVDGDPPAAYRYTEARLNKMAEELLQDIDKETVDFIPNFDDTRQEPVVLPAAYPNLIVNGSEGIAVGMATKIPPHNLGEVIDATVYLIDNPDAPVKSLMKYIKGPDFPTGASIMGNDGIVKAYTTGRGSIVIRGKYEIEESKKGREAIIITEIPFQVNKAALITRIAELVNEKVIEGISELRDESDRKGMRIYIGLKKEANSSVIINQLLKHTPLQSSFGIILLALVDGVPKILDLKAMITHYINHRRDVVIRRTKYDLRKAEERAHILEGLKIALENIDEVIAIIKASKTPDEASVKLIKRFTLTEIQAKAILEMRLQRLTSLEIKKIIDELKELQKLIAELTALLKSETKINNLIKSELLVIKEKYADKRRTEIVLGAESDTTFDMEDLIADESMIVSITNDGFIRRMPIDTFKKQGRGGKGVIGLSSKKEDFIKMMTVADTHDTIFLFSNKGKIFALKTYEIPQASKTSRGKSLKGIINLATGETITAICSIKDFDTEDYLCMATKYGILKKTSVNEFINAKKGGIICISLKKDDELVDVKVVEKESDIVIASRDGLLLRTNLQKMRSMGRTAAGIIGMRLEKDDYIIGMDIVKDDSFLFVITEKGYGKRVSYNNFVNKGRGGKGMAYLKISDKNGAAAGIRSVKENDEIVITSLTGMTIRLHAGDISLQGRATVGVKLLDLSDSDAISDFAVISESED
ncbi:MAG TPA: DNA gyrase subunit A [Spirochaetota bacterium]|nr:DNA gyrase subunit A [Spirochaetota bacterium]HOK92346.1 DNA gyrase subunit A [Spirochaetota bacterium]HON15220.1 DNA gyrase subunit A [Spirochaetota bacterium]HPD78762.1 DNA gyrase subunit A [Spirochaetota bacterium]HPP94911.1 DNA gyrase subunit A [Spirochaetota bacterium]